MTLPLSPAALPTFPWWYAVLIFVVANVISAVPAGLFGDSEFYNTLRKPSVSPPDWLFPPMWLVLNVTSLVALVLVANQPPETPNRTLFLWSEAVGWITFAAFTGLYFGLRSPTLGAVDTVIGLLAAGVSLYAASTIAAVPALLILPRLLWLLLASYVSVAVVLMNRTA